MPSIIDKKCTNCKICETVCPTKSIFPGVGQYVIDFDTCEGCKLCIQVCPVEAITYKLTAKEQKEKEEREREAAAKARSERG